MKIVRFSWVGLATTRERND